MVYANVKKVIGFVWLKPKAIGKFSAHGDMYSVSTKVKDFLVKNGGLVIFNFGIASKSYVSVNLQQKVGQNFSTLIDNLLQKLVKSHFSKLKACCV
jgi:hypothetical protein